MIRGPKKAGVTPPLEHDEKPKKPADQADYILSCYIRHALRHALRLDLQYAEVFSG